MLADMFSRLLHNNTHAHTTTTTTTTTTITTSSPLSQNAFSSPPSPPPAHPDSDPDTDFTMKDLSNAQSRASNRNTAYPKKRPSPVVRDGGVAKRKSGSPITAASVIAGLSRRLQDEEAASRRLAALQQHNLQKLLESEYRNDVLKYMHEMESATMSSAASMDQQPEIRWEMRPCLVDFIVECHMSLRLRPEVLYLTLNIVDRYVSRRVVYVKHYQLVGCTALWIAAKFEDAKERTPSVQDLVELCQNAYEPAAFLQMELHVLNTLQWLVGHPTAEAWLRFACSGGSNGGYIEDTATQNVARFLMEISLFHRDYINFGASAIASGALCLARHIMGKTRRPCDESRYSLQIVDMLDDHLSSHAHELSETLVKKYSYSYYGKASGAVLQFYLKGGRFVHSYLPECPPITPMSATASSIPQTPMSTTSSRSSLSESDDMPATPGTPTFAADPFTAGRNVLAPKDNLPLKSTANAKIVRVDDGLPERTTLASSPILNLVR